MSVCIWVCVCDLNRRFDYGQRACLSMSAGFVFAVLCSACMCVFVCVYSWCDQPKYLWQSYHAYNQMYAEYMPKYETIMIIIHTECTYYTVIISYDVHTNTHRHSPIPHMYTHIHAIADARRAKRILQKIGKNFRRLSHSLRTQCSCVRVCEIRVYTRTAMTGACSLTDSH